MSNDELDRMLTGDNIVASSGFASNVMDALQREASTPPPIPFPWKWALPLIAAGALVIVLFIMVATAPAQTVSAPPAFTAVIAEARRMGLEWIALAFVLTVASIRLSRLSS